MILNEPKIQFQIRIIAAITCIAFFAGCATTPKTARGPQYAPAADMMRAARSEQVPVEKRAADYLQVAAMTAPLLGTGADELAARNTYNAAAAHPQWREHNLPFAAPTRQLPLHLVAGLLHVV
jgi:hypothetical protein